MIQRGSSLGKGTFTVVNNCVKLSTVVDSAESGDLFLMQAILYFIYYIITVDIFIFVTFKNTVSTVFVTFCINTEL